MATRAAIRTALILMLCGMACNVLAQTAQSKTNSREDAKAAYCKATGGRLGVRSAYSSPSKPKEDVQLCEYRAPDGSRIYLSLETLTQTKPTQAVLAYYAQTPWNQQGHGVPAAHYCLQLGGRGMSATDPAVDINNPKGEDATIEMCVFPDNSMIDSWGLMYHSDNIVRGIDLSTVLKYPNPHAKKSK